MPMLESVRPSELPQAAASLGRRGVAQLARASVSKTEGRGFDPCHPCQSTYA